MICLPETRKLKNDNRGMSLVETLVAIAILSVAIGPLLYMFVFTTKYNAKAKLKQRATNAAVTVMENMKATSLDSFYKQFAIDADTGAHLDPTPFLYNDTGATYSVGSDVSDLNFTGKYWINDMSFSDAGVAGSPKYDVRIDVKNGRIKK